MSRSHPSGAERPSDLTVLEHKGRSRSQLPGEGTIPRASLEEQPPWTFSWPKKGFL